MKRYLQSNLLGLGSAVALLALLALGAVDPVSGLGLLPFVLGATLQFDVPVRNAILDAIETSGGTSVIVELRSGGLPANCAAATTGTLLAQASMPSDWMAAASGGTKVKAGVWTLVGLAVGTIGYFRMFRSGSPSECFAQGDVTATGGGGAMEVDNTSITVSQNVTVNTFTLTGPNA